MSNKDSGVIQWGQTPIILIQQNLESMKLDIVTIKSDIKYIKSKLNILVQEKEKKEIEEIQLQQAGWFS